MPTDTTRLPDWFDIHAEASEGAPLNPIEQFILDHEPAGPEDIEWRKQLAALIEWVKQ